MEALKKLISENIEYFTLGGIIITLLGVLLAFYFYSKSKRVRKSVYHKVSFNLINGSISKLKGLEVNYKGNHVNNLTITKVAIWNAGNQTINNTDIVALDPLRVEASEANEIYNIEIIDVVEKANNFSLIQDGDKFNINFDYCDTKEGCLIRIYHSGKNSDNIRILGKIKGQGDISIGDQLRSNIYLSQMLNSKVPFFIKEMFLIVVKIGWLIYLSGAIISLYYVFHDKNYWLTLLTFICIGAVYIIYPRRMVPRKLSKIFSDDK